MQVAILVAEREDPGRGCGIEDSGAKKWMETDRIRTNNVISALSHLFAGLFG